MANLGFLLDRLNITVNLRIDNDSKIMKIKYGFI